MKIIIKNSIAVILLALGSFLILYFIGAINEPYRMTHAMEILTKGSVAIVAVPLGIVFLTIARVLSTLPIYWVFRLVFVLSLAIVVHNAWLYSYVSYEIKLRSSVVYPELGQDIYAFVLLGLLLIGSFHFSRDDNVTYFNSLK